MDIVAGLHWLKENLPAFGGDPDRITIMGHGTGAALANFIAASPTTKGKLVQNVRTFYTYIRHFIRKRKPSIDLIKKKNSTRVSRVNKFKILKRLTKYVCIN